MISISPELSSRISVLCFVCACMVVLIHVPVPSTVGSAGWYLSSIFSYGACLISVPFFLIVSGFFLGRHLGENALAFPIFLIHYFSLIILIKWNVKTDSALGFIGSYAFMLCSSICACLLIRNLIPKKIVSLMLGGR